MCLIIKRKEENNFTFLPSGLAMGRAVLLLLLLYGGTQVSLRETALRLVLVVQLQKRIITNHLVGNKETKDIRLFF